jgi:glycosyltransferase involved in cell wall biosynthesis
VPRKPLSILLVYDCIYPESIGGVEHRNLEIAKALGRRGHRVTIAGWTTKPRQIDDRVDVISLRFVTPLHGPDGKRSATTSLRFALACSLLPVRDYDVIETANIPYIHLIPLAICCCIARRKLVVTWHEYWGKYWPQYVGRLRAPLFAAIERMSANIGACVVAVSQMTATRVQQSRRAASEVVPIPCGLDLLRIRAAAARVERQANVLVYAGRLAGDKRLPLIIGAVATLRQTGTDVRLRIIGDGPDRSALEKLTGELRLTPHVEFTGRLETPDEVWKHIAQSRIAVTASLREGFGMFPLEALACGTPVVYCESPDSALPEIVGDGHCGFVAEPTSAAISGKIRRLLQDRDLWLRLSTNALKNVERYSWDGIAEQTENVLYAAVQQPR